MEGDADLPIGMVDNTIEKLHSLGVPPESFAEELMTEWSLWVLDHGLPAAPSVLAKGHSVPVARWAGPRFGAVLHVSWSGSDDAADDHLRSDVEVFRRTELGWELSNGGGGAGWFAPPFERPREIGRAVVQVVHHHGSGGPGWRCCSVDGLCGSDAVTLTVEDSDGVTVRPVESPSGVFIVCSDAHEDAILRVLDAADNVLLLHTFSDPA